MEPLRVNGPRFRITNLACATALLLGFAALCAPNPAAAADSGGIRVHHARVDHPRLMRRGGVMVRRQVVVERGGSPQVAAGGTVVLRGSRSGIPNTSQPNAPAFGQGYGSSLPPIGLGRPTPGWDHELDTGGTDYGISPTYDLGR